MDDEQAADGLIAAIRRDHVWFKCEQPCETPYCVYCEGGLAYCVVCKQGEAELEPRCPGQPETAVAKTTGQKRRVTRARTPRRRK
jgi:hypothetical protein